MLVATSEGIFPTLITSESDFYSTETKKVSPHGNNIERVPRQIFKSKPRYQTTQRSSAWQPVRRASVWGGRNPAADGLQVRVKQLGKAGTGPGELHLPHAIQISEDGTIYVADRERGRIEEFDLNGNYVGEIPHLGRIYSLKLVAALLWAGMQPSNQPPGSPGWVVEFDRKTGKMLGHLDVPQGVDCIRSSRWLPGANHHFGQRVAMV